jgi:hypothetical protein
MKLKKTAGKTSITMSKSEWLSIGKQAQWTGMRKESQSDMDWGTRYLMLALSKSPHLVSVLSKFGSLINDGRDEREVIDIASEAGLYEYLESVANVLERQYMWPIRKEFDRAGDDEDYELKNTGDIDETY